ncbi:integumentary mucin C.1-like [Scaptodrosophila lebanonensis]|uniref:Integumentary mucin C.1-like n=1 Tax=Drosophila lebanonensis TaxID=7225 RepID=A0A6J2UI48_DROLE|nr:integumentary mucin C.1-like [Scaptodrosophila lebanonensis]
MKRSVGWSLFSLCLLLSQMQAQDVEPEFPEDFTTTTTMRTTTLAEGAEVTTLEPIATEPTTIGSTTTTTTTTTQVETSTPENSSKPTTPLPNTTDTPPQYLPPLTTPSPPDYGSTEPGLWDGQTQEHCYLKEHYERRYWRFSCGVAGWHPAISCYRCCYYSSSSFAGCQKLHNGHCGYYY